MTTALSKNRFPKLAPLHDVGVYSSIKDINKVSLETPKLTSHRRISSQAEPIYGNSKGFHSRRNVSIDHMTPTRIYESGLATARYVVSPRFSSGRETGSPNNLEPLQRSTIPFLHERKIQHSGAQTSRSENLRKTMSSTLQNLKPSLNQQANKLEQIYLREYHLKIHGNSKMDEMNERLLQQNTEEDEREINHEFYDGIPVEFYLRAYKFHFGKISVEQKATPLILSKLTDVVL